jgi:DNA replication protein DnaD
MKTKNKAIEKEFDTVKTFRAIKEKISIEISSMSFEQIKAYLEVNSKKFDTK